MSVLSKLQQSTSLKDLAKLLGFKPSSLSYILYIKDEKDKYYQFEIPKKSGGMRTITAPNSDLKLLQKRLSILLQDCIDEINKKKEVKDALSHGFRRKKSIITNSEKHRKKRYVFNIDLEDFFGTINFGRVRGFFIKNRNFLLNEKVATVIAQIICHKNSLPQGSPCSPVVSNLISHMLDIKLASLAFKTGCTYSRYADDITFSSNKKVFPKKIATKLGGNGHGWTHGVSLERIIKNTGFTINISKTRMQYKDSRQNVTGLIVNSKINTPSEYWRTVRSMVHNLFETGGAYKKTHPNEKLVGNEGNKIELSINQLNGMLGFIDQQDFYNKKKFDINLRQLCSRESLYRQFLFYKNFYSPEYPKIICEGKTDNIYIRESIKSLSTNYPKLISKKEGILVDFFKYTKISDRLCWLAGGTADLTKFINTYAFDCRKFKIAKHKNPTIIIIDNDKGSSSIYSVIKNKISKKSGRKIKKIDGSDPFYYFNENLYVIAIPKIGNSDTMIEDYFSKKVLATKLNNKTFSKSNNFNPKTQYGKHVFATEIIKKNASNISFNNFSVILDKIVAVIDDHKKRIA